VHLHPTQQCNLSCIHCYSSSSPNANQVLDIDDVCNSLKLMREEGYTTLSLSGGEPFLYPKLAKLLDYARTLEFRIIAITNGIRIRPKYLPLIEQIDSIGVSLDGPADLHNEIRGHPDAYMIAIRALDYLCNIGKPTSLAYTVSRRSLASIPEIIELAAGKQIKSVQLRPLVSAGRAKLKCNGEFLSDDDLNRLYLIGLSLSDAYGGKPFVHTDLVHASHLVRQRGLYRSVFDRQAVRQQLSSLVNPLVITTTGTMKPFTYDFPEKFDLGQIAGLGPKDIEAIKTRLCGAMQSLLSNVFFQLERSERFIDWFAYCRDVADQPEFHSAI